MPLVFPIHKHVPIGHLKFVRKIVGEDQTLLQKEFKVQRTWEVRYANLHYQLHNHKNSTTTTSWRHLKIERCKNRVTMPIKADKVILNSRSNIDVYHRNTSACCLNKLLWQYNSAFCKTKARKWKNILRNKTWSKNDLRIIGGTTTMDGLFWSHFVVKGNLLRLCQKFEFWF